MPNKHGENTERDNTVAGAPDAAALAARLGGAGRDGERSLPPVHLWDPPFCGDLDMRIARDGTWFYMGSPIGRKRLVRLFSTVLRHDDDGRYYLVTPVEKIGITVDDAPFVAVEMTVEGRGEDQVLRFRSNVGDWVTADAEHPIRVALDDRTGEPRPYVLMRDRLEALIARSVYYDLVDLGVERKQDGERVFGVWSSGAFFTLGKLSETER